MAKGSQWTQCPAEAAGTAVGFTGDTGQAATAHTEQACASIDPVCEATYSQVSWSGHGLLYDQSVAEYTKPNCASQQDTAAGNRPVWQIVRAARSTNSER